MTTAESRWEIVIHQVARKDLKPFRHVLGDLEAKIAILETRPDAGEELTGSLKGVRSLKFSLRGVGECRVAYVKMTPDRICLLFLIASRESFYVEATRRLDTIRRSQAADS
jgi:mRNA-degrading endonuclease RelE of RelBE toxin-antitoxin system